MNLCPANTLKIIAQLERLGFTNAHFQYIHHWGSVKGKDSSLASHKKYLAKLKGDYRVGSNNFKVAMDLENCLEKAKAYGRRLDCVSNPHHFAALPDKNKRELRLNSLPILHRIPLLRKWTK